VERRGEAVNARALPGAALLFGLLLLPACASALPRFRWEVYDETVYRECAARDADPADLARTLGEEMDRAAREGVAPPPGVRAQLGHLRLLAGDAAGAREMFRAEKEAYPEGAVFMDRLLSRLEP